MKNMGKNDDNIFLIRDEYEEHSIIDILNSIADVELNNSMEKLREKKQIRLSNQIQKAINLLISVAKDMLKMKIDYDWNDQ